MVGIQIHKSGNLFSVLALANGLLCALSVCDNFSVTGSGEQDVVFILKRRAAGRGWNRERVNANPKAFVSQTLGRGEEECYHANKWRWCLERGPWRQDSAFLRPPSLSWVTISKARFGEHCSCVSDRGIETMRKPNLLLKSLRITKCACTTRTVL